MVESISLISYPARRSGVDTARMPNGAVASWLEKAGKKKTIFFFGITEDSRGNISVLLVWPCYHQDRIPGGAGVWAECKNYVKSARSVKPCTLPHPLNCRG